MGLTLGAVIAASVSASNGGFKVESESTELEGYRATFFMCFAAMASVVVIGAWGLRAAGKVGIKKE